MAFTLLDVDARLVCKPPIMDSNRFLTIHIRIDLGKVTIRKGCGIYAVPAKLGIPLQTIFCGCRCMTMPLKRKKVNWR